MGIRRRLQKKIKKIIYGNGYVLKKVNNLILLLRASNHVDRELLGGSYEAKQISEVISLINNKHVDYFVDVGANIGVYSLRIAKECLGIEKVFAIEAQIENYNQLCANIRLNNLDRLIETHNVGASNKTGEVEFLVNKGSSTGTSRIKKTMPTGTSLRKFDSHIVPVDKLDLMLNEIKDSRVFFKIDVEGHERNVLKGMAELIAENHCFFQIEILEQDHDGISREFGLTKMGQIGNDTYFESP